MKPLIVGCAQTNVVFCASNETFAESYIENNLFVVRTLSELHDVINGRRKRNLTQVDTSASIG
jgi:hypothetical protein